MKKGNDFDSVAFVYDELASIIFGKSITESQLLYLDKIPAGAKVLILGGGTGWLAKKLLDLNSTCTLVYVEASVAMLKKSRGRMSASDLQRIQFIHSDKILLEETFDVVIANFFLDLFQPAVLNEVIQKIRGMLHKNGSWIITDFVNEGRWWQQTLLWIMYSFFKMIAGIEATSLPPWEKMLKESGSLRIQSASFYGGFIKSQIIQYVE